ncbi:hypothetical protein CYY_006430 [Polysphondylium violaceum]|uniref:Transmembrane protein n=1 Tax=Polysphondylium violaceum TaxID=133409 RepID=A0A8J4V5Y8_9MYCE|nr:hypothetical protein CYY_006430 [Polysphondylium violaceum]
MNTTFSRNLVKLVPKNTRLTSNNALAKPLFVKSSAPFGNVTLSTSIFKTPLTVTKPFVGGGGLSNPSNNLCTKPLLTTSLNIHLISNKQQHQQQHQQKNNEINSTKHKSEIGFGSATIGILLLVCLDGFFQGDEIQLFPKLQKAMQDMYSEVEQIIKNPFMYFLGNIIWLCFGCITLLPFCFRIVKYISMLIKK